MENIDEDIKIVEELLKEFKTYNDLDGIQDLRLYIKAIENLLSRLKTAERMNDVLAEQNVKSCEWYYSEFDNYTKDDFIKWARKKVEEND